MDKYSAKVTSTTLGRELSHKEKVMLTTADTVVLGQYIDENGGSVVVENPYYLAVVEIHNPKNAENGDIDYNSYLLVTTDGTIFSTSSISAFEGISDIFAEMLDEDGTPVEPFSIRFTKKQSKNTSGKFISVSLV